MYRINLFKHIIALRNLFYFTIILFLIIYYSNMSLSLAWIGLAPFLLPVIYIHIQYYIENNKYILSYNNSCIKIKIDQEISCISFDEILSIELNASGGIYKRIDWENSTFQSYHYIKIVCHNNAYYITSLLFLKPIEEELHQFIYMNKDKYTRKKRFISTIKR